MSRRAPSKRTVAPPPQPTVSNLPPQFQSIQWSNPHPAAVDLSISPREIPRPSTSRVLRRQSISPYTPRSSARTTNQLLHAIPIPTLPTPDASQYVAPPAPNGSLYAALPDPEKLLRVEPSTPENPLYSLPLTPAAGPAPKSLTSPPPALEPLTTKRPANAFIMFRSDFLKSEAVQNVENRQQLLSRVAGQVWNMLPEKEKNVWHQKAADALATYRLTNPGHKSAPRRRKGKKKQERLEGTALDERVTELRELLTPYVGPAPPPSRSKARAVRKSTRAARVHYVSEAPENTQVAPVPESTLHHTAHAGPSRMAAAAAATVAPVGRSALPYETNLLQFVPPRRPSTSLGLPSTYEIGRYHPYLNSKGELLPLPTRPSSATPDHSITNFNRGIDYAPQGPLIMPFGTHPLNGLDYSRRYLGGDPHLSMLASSITAPAALGVPLSAVPEDEGQPFLSQFYNPGLAPSDTITHSHGQDPLQTAQLSATNLDMPWHLINLPEYPN